MTTEAKVGAFTVVGILLFAAVAALLSGVSFSGEKGYTLYAGFKQVIGVEPQSVAHLKACPWARSRASPRKAALRHDKSKAPRSKRTLR